MALIKETWLYRRWKTKERSGDSLGWQMGAQALKRVAMVSDV